MSNQATAAVVFDALGEPVRRQILELLGDGPRPVHELADRLPVNRPAVSKHLRVLSQAGLTEHRSVGTSNVYYLRRDGLEAARAWLTETWEGVLGSYAAAAREEAERLSQNATEKRGGRAVPELPPLHFEVKVDLDPEQAFDLFTGRIGDWWPMGRHSVYGTDATVAFADDGSLVESHGGQTAVWGEVIEWMPGERLVLTWHPGGPADRAGRVTVTFSSFGEQTLVVLEHSAWEAQEDPVAVRNEYENGWPTVVKLYGEAAGETGDGEPAPVTWVALQHSRGPSAPEGSLFEDSRFAGHVSFLNEMEEAGYLIAAGPMLDSDGGGMTILRLPGADRLEEAGRLAREDASVSGGLLDVRVRPWQVVAAPAVSP